MTLYDLKPAFQSCLRPTVRRLAAVGVTANQVTVAAALVSMAIGAAIFLTDDNRLFLLLPVWLGLRMALNAVDGILAREHGQRSRLGGFLNEIGDVVSDTALYAPFAILPSFGAAPVAVVVFLTILTEFAGVVSQAHGSSRRYDGPMGKSDRALVFGVLGLWIGLGGALPDWTEVILWVIAGLLVLTTMRRIRGGLCEPERGRHASNP